MIDLSLPWQVLEGDALDVLRALPDGVVQTCVLAGCPQGGLVLDPFAGSGTVGVVALRNGCRFVGLELNPQYVALARGRIGRFASQTLLPLRRSSGARS